MTLEECCQILGVSAGATQDEIKKAFKRKAAICHPDKGGNEEEFKKLNSAYQILSGKQQSTQQPFENNGVDLNDIFGDSGGFGFDPFANVFFRQGKQESIYPEHDKDVRINFQITAEDVRQGRTMKVNFQKSKKCTDCNGIGGKSKVICNFCQGQGTMRQTRQEGNMFWQNITTCNSCLGARHHLVDPCRKCNASGVIIYNDSMIIEIKEKK